jgi:hypothetical protein
MIYQNIVESDENLSCIFSGSALNGSSNSIFDASSKSLLMGLLTNRPQMRLGVLRDGIDELWAHPVLKGE